MPQLDVQLFQSFTDAVPLGVCLVDTQCKIIYWNGAAEAITGYLAHEVLGRAYRGDLLIQRGTAESTLVTRCPVTEVLHDGHTVKVELFLRHKLGHRVPVQVTAFALRDERGEVCGVAEIFEPQRSGQCHSLYVPHVDREFEMAMGPAAIEESTDQLRILLRSRAAETAAVILIEMSDLQTLRQHGGTAMLHQAVRVVAKTVAALLPARHYVGCWSNWRLIAIVPECKAESLTGLQSTLASIGSSCAVKWWGDRVIVKIRACARTVDRTLSADELMYELEQQMQSAMEREE